MDILVLFFCLGLFSSTNASVVNRTIDDTLGDSSTGQRPTFLPTGSNVWQGPSCGATCTIQPDHKLAFSGTFTAATNKIETSKGIVTIDFSFEGTAVWIYFILANAQTAVNITIDDGAPSLFRHVPAPATDEILYNQLAYSSTELENITHKVRISSSPSIIQWVNFDYAIYMHDDGTPSVPSTQDRTHTSAQLGSPSTISTNSLAKSTPTTYSSVVGGQLVTTTQGPTSSATIPIGSSKIPLAVLIGSITGSVVGAALLVFLFVFFIYRRRASKDVSAQDAMTRPFPPQDGGSLASREPLIPVTHMDQHSGYSPSLWLFPSRHIQADVSPGESRKLAMESSRHVGEIRLRTVDQPPSYSQS